MEDDLKVLKVEYLSKHCLDLSQILNLSLCEQTESKHCLKWWLPLMEDDLKILEGEFLLCLGDPT